MQDKVAVAGSVAPLEVEISYAQVTQPTNSPPSPALSAMDNCQPAIKLPSHNNVAETAPQVYEMWKRNWRGLGSSQAAPRAKEFTSPGVGAQTSAEAARAREAQWRAMLGVRDASGIAKSKSFESLCARVLQSETENAAAEHLTHGDMFNLTRTYVNQGDICGIGDAKAIWTDKSVCVYPATSNLRIWTPGRRDIWGEAIRTNASTIQEAIDNFYFATCDARASVSDHECLADCLMSTYVRDYVDEDATGVWDHDPSISLLRLLRNKSEKVDDVTRVKRGVLELFSYAYYESMTRVVAKTLGGLDQHGATCAIADTMWPGQSDAYMVVRALTSGITQTIGFMEGLAELAGRNAVPFAYSKIFAYINDANDMATDVETGDTNIAAETIARLGTTAAAAYNCVRQMCMGQDDYSVVACCVSIYHAIMIRHCNMWAWVEKHPASEESSAAIQAQDNAHGRRIKNWLVSAQQDGGGRSIRGLSDMIDWVTSVVAGDRSSQTEGAELDVAICEWYRALIHCYSAQALGLSIGQRGDAIAAFKRAELTVRRLISKRDDAELVLYAMRWVGANDGEAARGRAWWCEPQVINTGSVILDYSRRPSLVST